jgi:hypothetical protein
VSLLISHISFSCWGLLNFSCQILLGKHYVLSVSSKKKLV